jgi:hypothetical protein
MTMRVSSFSRPVWPVALVVLAMAVTEARGQDAPFVYHAAGVLTAPLSGTADSFNPGFGAAAGVTWNLAEYYGVRADVAWSTLTAKSAPASAGASLSVSGNVGYVNADFVFRGQPSRARLYVLAGIGVYRRAVTLTGSGSGAVDVCNPWWFVCESGAVSVARVVGTRSTTNVGINVGFGATFARDRVFAEVRFHYAAGPTYRTPQGDQIASGKFFPLMIGARF